MKPLITFRRGYWYCSTYRPGAWVGAGDTPSKAYANWAELHK